MGYREPVEVFRLTFTERPGLEVDVESTTVDHLIDLMTLADLADKATGAEQAQAASDLITAFSGCLHKWNVEDKDGNPVACTREGVGSIKFNFAFEIITAWLSAISGVSDPLPNGSAGGAPSLVESIATETL